MAEAYHMNNAGAIKKWRKAQGTILHARLGPAAFKAVVDRPTLDLAFRG
jgi:hypothetical protein